MKFTRCIVLLSLLILVDSCEGLIDGLQVARTVTIYVGVVLSITGLILLIITHLAFKNVRKKDVTKFHIQLALATLLLLILEVTTGIIQVITTDVDAAGCITFIATTYYFVLVAFMWMGAEGVLLCQKVFCVFKKTTTLYLFIVSFVCWTVPLLPVIISVSVNSNSHIERNITALTDCFLATNKYLGLLVVVPMLIIQVLNIGIFTSCCIVVIRHKVKMKKAGGQTEQSTATSAKQICKMISGLAGIVCLLGLPMLVRFGGAILIVFVKHPTALSILLWLLQIYNSFQGFALFVLITAIDSNLRKKCSQLLCGCIRKKHPHGLQSRALTSTSKMSLASNTTEIIHVKHEETART